MRAVLQRVSEASVTVDGTVTGAIQSGILLLLGVGPNDGEDQVRWLARKVAEVRLFEDDAGKMNRSVTDIGGGVLVVPQFTLYGTLRKGRRPSFNGAAHPSIAEPLYDRFCAVLAAHDVPVERGVFGAHMDVRLLNDGPVTLVLDTP